MGRKKKLYCSLYNWGLLVLLSGSLFASCNEDLQMSEHSGSNISFSISDGTDWNYTRTIGDLDKGTTPLDSLLGILPLQTADCGDQLYIHAFLSDNTESALHGSDPMGTRSAPVTDMGTYGKFGVFAYLYQGAWDGSATPDFMYNTEVRGEDGVWSSSANYYWPGQGKKLRFFAYAPYNAQGVVLPRPHEAGHPDLTFNVPDAVNDQHDLLVAASGEMAGDYNATASLSFNHILTAVRFVVGDDMQKGKVTNITLRGVYSKAIYNMNDGLWSSLGIVKNFSQSLDKTIDGESGAEITIAAGTFMMIPQLLPQNAEIEVAFTDNITGTQRTLKASIAGTTWPKGKMVTYRISTSSISVVPTFTVTAPNSFEYTGGTDTYSITSYATVSRIGDPTETVPMAWKAEFSTDGGHTWVQGGPDWLTTFTTSGSGSISASNFTAEVAAQQAVVSNSHDEALLKATPVSGIYNLATNGGQTAMNTANCYIINAPGSYKLPLVYGNAIKEGMNNSSAYTSSVTGVNVLQKFVNHRNAAITDPYIYNNTGCTPNNACVVWQDGQELITNVRLIDNNKFLAFDVPAGTIHQGNAIVALRDASNTIMWSWHIWVTDYVPGLDATVDEQYDPTKTARDKIVTNSANTRYTFMGTNLGWCEPAIITYPSRNVKVRFTQEKTGSTKIITLNQLVKVINSFGNSPSYQFGRKDPMIPGILQDDGTNIEKPYYSEGNYRFNQGGDGKVSLGIAIRNPHIFYNCGNSSSGQFWFDANATVSGKSFFYNLWSINNATGTNKSTSKVIKTIYDPSPVGYCVPPENAFWGFTWTKQRVIGDWKYINTPPTSRDKQSMDKGWTLYCNRMTGVDSYDPSGGVIFFPASGKRIYTSGVLSDIGRSGFYLVVEPNNNTSVGGMDFSLPNIAITPSVTNGGSHGFSVRPIREKP